jgi:hypothetical protein
MSAYVADRKNFCAAPEEYDILSVHRHERSARSVKPVELSDFHKFHHPCACVGLFIP